MTDLGPIRKKLLGLRGRIWTALLLDGSARVAGALLGAVVLSFALDRVFKLETLARGVLLLAGLAALAFVVWRFLMRRLNTLPEEDPLAIAVERRFPELKDRLISALQLSRETDPEKYGMSPQLVEDAIKEAIDPVEGVRFREIIATERVAKAVALGVVALLLLTAGAAADPESAGIWFKRNVLLQSVRWPQKTYLRVDPSRFPGRVARIVRGSDIVVTAQSIGEVHPERAEILFEDSEGERGRATMKADVKSHIYRHEFQDVQFPITFHLEGGDEVTDEYRIELMEAPEVTEIEVKVGFPEYAGREPSIVDLADGDPEMLVGGYVTLTGTSSKPLKGAQVVLGESEEDAVDAQVVGTHGFTVTFSPKKTVLAGLRLRDKDGLTNPSLAPRFLVRVAKDRAPKVRLTKSGIGTMVVEGAVFPYLVRIRDDVKAVEGRIEVKKAAGDRQSDEAHVIGLDAEQLNTHEADVSGRIEISTLKAKPGAFLVFTAYAKDNARPEAHEGKSDQVTVKVVTLEELFSELLRRQQEQRTLFEELIKKERRLRDRFRDLRDNEPPSPAELRISITSQGQTQREIARRVRAIERAMMQILDEMANNRIYVQARIAELRRKVVRAMVNLRTVVMADHAKNLDTFANRAEQVSLTGDDGTAIDEGYGRVLAAMNKVLAQMVKVEGFTEIVERMRGILKLHGEVRDETRRKYEAVMAEIFGDEEKK
jgi:hypothetical protein